MYEYSTPLKVPRGMLTTTVSWLVLKEDGLISKIMSVPMICVEKLEKMRKMQEVLVATRKLGLAVLILKKPNERLKGWNTQLSLMAARVGSKVQSPCIWSWHAAGRVSWGGVKVMAMRLPKKKGEISEK